MARKEIGSMMRVLFITNIPSPYQLDFFTELDSWADIDIHVLFAASSEGERQFQVPNSMPFSAQIIEGGTWRFLQEDAHYAKGISRYLRSFANVDVAIISGSYFMPSALQFRRWANRHRVPWLYWGEDPWKKGATTLRRWKELYLRWFLAKSMGALGVGEMACNNYWHLMNKAKLVYNLPYAPNLEPIIQPSQKVLDAASEYRSVWKTDDPEVILFSGSLSHRKAPDVLVAAFCSLAPRYPAIRLLFAGDGPLRSSLQEAINSAGLQDRVRFLGFLEDDALRAAYISANLFVLPTRTHEGWGVVVQEALAAGLPMLVSDRVGSRHDLINHDTGGTFKADDTNSLIVALDAQLSDPQRGSDERRRQRVQRAEATSSKAAANYFRAVLLRNILGRR